MTEVYTAPTNGHVIRPTFQGGLRINKPGMDYVDGHEPQTLVAGRVESLREYFRDERDQELGRWRYPDNPDYVVAPRTRKIKGQRVVRVFRESTGNVNDIREVEPIHRSDDSLNAARAYFAAHPEKKPWHDAKPGEVWEVTVQGDRTPTALTVIEEQGLFFYDPVEDIRIHVKGFISLARRIWPESKES